MAKRRNTQVELCFDSMSDLITNLAGGLILLVLLLLGVTKEAASQTPPSEAPPPDTKKEAAEKSIVPLQTRINLMKSEIKQIDDQIKQVQQALPELQAEVNKLLEKVQQVQPPPEKKEPEKEKEPEEVKFRPPRLKVEQGKDTPVFLVCRNQRIYFFDFKTVGDEFQRNPRPATVQVSLGDFDARYETESGVRFNGNQLVTVTYMSKVELIPKAGRQGESLEDFLRGTSSSRKRLGQLKPEDNIVQFMVYPDSYDTFRAAREVIYDLKFSTNWIPRTSVQPLVLSGGTGGVGTQ